jgi:hypothetical protein
VDEINENNHLYEVNLETGFWFLFLRECRIDDITIKECRQRASLMLCFGNENPNRAKQQTN